MTKEEFVAKVAADVSLPKTRVNEVLKSFIGNISDALKKGDKVTFIGFGSFQVAQRAARMGRNPQTGKKQQFPATKVPKFRPSRKLRDRIS